MSISNDSIKPSPIKINKPQAIFQTPIDTKQKPAQAKNQAINNPPICFTYYLANRTYQSIKKAERKSSAFFNKHRARINDELICPIG
jgi:hypothetical protein